MKNSSAHVLEAATDGKNEHLLLKVTQGVTKGGSDPHGVVHAN